MGSPLLHGNGHLIFGHGVPLGVVEDLWGSASRGVWKTTEGRRKPVWEGPFHVCMCVCDGVCVCQCDGVCVMVSVMVCKRDGACVDDVGMCV